MAITKNQYTGDGSTVNYTFTFEYINETDVKVELDGVSTTAYSFANATTLTFDSAPANGAAILIYRDTDIDTLDATFFPGSAIKAEDLNSNFTQNNFAVQEIQANTWDNERETIHSDETWISNNAQIATTAAIDARFQDELSETIESTETWVADDDHIATTQAIENRIDEVITNDISTDGTGITVTDDGDGTITLGLADNSIDFSKIKDDDIITYAEQESGPSPADSNIFTASAAARRFDTLVQTSTPSGSDWETGKTWLQNDQDKRLSIWNGSEWLGVVSGGTFTTQPKVVYVDASSGDDANDGHRISRPKLTIKAAVEQINADATYGDGSVVVVAPGTYQEEAPIDITRANVSIIGQALRSCIVHPTVATETESLFRVSSGSYLSGLTFTGIKASGAIGNTVDANLPVNQGWNVSFYPGATIIKSPYIQNCTNFSDSEIDNSNLNVITPAGGAAGDTDSQPTGGGLLVDGSTVDSNSPLRSMVCDSYTHVGLNGPGILVTNNGYAQCTSSYAFFNRYHIKALNGGQANLAASTTDFGNQALVADGRSVNAIFTSTTTATANDGDISFTIDTPSVGSPWHGSSTRPQSNMLVDIGGNTYPILSATANGSGWDVTISRPNPSKRDENLGLDGAVSNGSAVSFYLRSLIASSGHTMEYVGSGTDYSALPENGGVPVEANQVVELNNGKVWTATTDHNGKFKVGDFFTVDQRTGFVTVPVGSISFPTLAEDLNVNGHEITSASDGNVVINPNGTGDIVLDANVGIGTSTPVQDLDIYGASPTIRLAKPGANTYLLQDSTNQSVLYNDGAGAFNIKTFQAQPLTLGTNNNERLRIDSNGNVGIGTSHPDAKLEASLSSTGKAEIARFRIEGQANNPMLRFFCDEANKVLSLETSGSVAGSELAFETNGQERVRINSLGNVGIGTTNPQNKLSILQSEVADAPARSSALYLQNNANCEIQMVGNSINDCQIRFGTSNTSFKGAVEYQLDVDDLVLYTSSSEAMRITSAGKVGIGTSDPDSLLVLSAAAPTLKIKGLQGDPLTNPHGYIDFENTNAQTYVAARIIARGQTDAARNGQLLIQTNSDGVSDPTANLATAVTIDQAGNVGIGTTSPGAPLEISNASPLIRLRDSDGTNTYGEVSASTGALFIGHRNNTANGQIIFQGQGGGAVNEYARFDTAGRLLVGTSSSTVSLAAVFQGNSAGTDPGAVCIAFDSNTPANNAVLGALDFSDSSHVRAARIECNRDGGTWTSGSTGSQPSRLVFSTTADGASSPTERMRITSDGRVRIGIAPPDVGYTFGIKNFSPSSGTSSWGSVINATANTDSTSQVNYSLVLPNLQDTVVAYSNIYGYRVFQGSYGTNPTVTHNTGFMVDSTLVGGTNNYGFRSAIASASGRWNFYASGTAANYFAGTIASLGSYNDTTASAANVFIASNGDIQRSTSSIRYKTDIETLEQSYADKVILNARPVWYRSLCEADNAGWSYYGLIAEEVAELDPRLVFWGRPTKEVISEEAKPAVFDDDGNEIEPAQEATYTNVEDTDAELRPEGVQYDRLTVMLIDVVQRQQKTIEALEARLTAAGL